MIGDHANFLQSLGWAALNSLWQMALLWILFQMTVVSGKLKPSLKSLLASAFLIAGFAWFVITFIISFSSPAPLSSFSTGVLNLEGAPAVNNWFLQVLPVLSIIYLALLVFPVLRFIKNYRYVQIIRRYGLSKINIDSRIYVNKTAFHLGIKRKVQIWISDLVSSPVTIGFLKPLILIPVAAINQLSTQQLEAILLHELAHIKRHDYFINLLINIIRTILYFNPFVKAFIKITERERETSCDELVLQFQYNSNEYAAALLTLEKANHTQPVLALPAAGKKTVLLHRVENILGMKESRKPFNIYKTGGFILSLCLIASISLLSLVREQQTADSGFAANDHIFGTPGLVPESPVKNEIEVAELPVSTVVNTGMAEQAAKKMAEHPVAEIQATPVVNDPDMINVAYTIARIPELKAYQEEQIRSALEASKKVLENSQWKTVEKNIADVLTEKEKEELKASYQQELEKFDWNKWENKLRTVYDHVNWEKVNYQLNDAITQIKIDSLQHVYANVARKLNEVQKELNVNKIKGIPDSDISLETIAEKKVMVQRILNELKAVKTKKIVHL